MPTDTLLKMPLNSKVQIFWAQDSGTKGRKLIFTDQELEDLEKVKMDFLKDQFIQVIDFDKMKKVQIYSLR